MFPEGYPSWIILRIRLLKAINVATKLNFEAFPSADAFATRRKQNGAIGRHKERGNKGVQDVGANAAKGAAAGAAAWGAAGTAVGLVGFGANGIAAGSTAASMMLTAAVANGGGVAAGSAVAMLQSVGAVGLATPVGLGLLAIGVVVGGLKALFAKRRTVDGTERTVEATKATEGPQDAVASANESWLLLEWLSAAVEPVQTRFLSESEDRAAYNKSPSAKRMLCRSDLTCIDSTPEYCQ